MPSAALQKQWVPAHTVLSFAGLLVPKNYAANILMLQQLCPSVTLNLPGPPTSNGCVGREPLSVALNLNPILVSIFSSIISLYNPMLGDGESP